MKVYIQTQGCSLNQSDSEAMAGSIKAKGHEIVDSQQEADVILYNTCTVKNPTEDSFFSKLSKQNKPVVIAGCIPQADKSDRLDEYVTIGTEQLQRAGDAIEAAAQNKSFKVLDQSSEKRLNIPKVRINPHREIIPILKGCLSSCTYCKTKQARGTLRSFRPSEIEKQVRSAVREGVKEILLTSQDNATYGRDIGLSPAILLRRLCEIEGDFKIRFGMANPDWIRRDIDELIQVFKHEKMYKFLHLPIQAGSNEVLKHMRRRCTKNDIRNIVSAFQSEIPHITIATDIICGYPIETQDQFQETLDLVNELQFQIVNISKFYPRPDTLAATLDKLPTDVVKARSKRMTELFNSAQFATQHDWMKDTLQEVLFTKKVKSNNIGHTLNYIQVIVHSNEDLSGQAHIVHVQDTTRDYVIGLLTPHAPKTNIATMQIQQ